MSSDVAIRVSNLCKSYQIYNNPSDRLKQSLWRRKQFYTEFKALSDVSFEVKRGETFGVIGRNGSGKSTLLQIICGTLSPTSGTVEVNGRVAALLELGAGFNPEFTGRENVYMNAAILGLSKEEIDARYDEIVAFADIGDFIDQPAKTYSSGMYVRLAFSVAMNVDPDILIVDEALAVGDAYFVHRCGLRFKEMQKRGVTILLVTHDASAVKRMCQNTIWLNDGAVEKAGDPSAVVDHYLAFLFKRPVVLSGEEGADRDEESSIKINADHDAALIENEIPNIDRRIGNQACSIIGVGLYDINMNPLTSTANDSQVIFRMSIKNNTLATGSKYSAGYIFRNFRGEDMASTNSVIESADIGFAEDGEILTLRMVVDIPTLYPGSYSLTPTAGYIDSVGEIVLGDRIDNAMVFEITSDCEMHTMMKFKTNIIRENR